MNDSTFFLVGCTLAVLAGACVALSMCINRYSFAHAESFEGSWCGFKFTVKPVMVWLLAMLVRAPHGRH